MDCVCLQKLSGGCVEMDLHASSDSLIIKIILLKNKANYLSLLDLNAHYCSFLFPPKLKHCVINTAAATIQLYQPANWLIMNYLPTEGKK